MQLALPASRHSFLAKARRRERAVSQRLARHHRHRQQAHGDRRQAEADDAFDEACDQENEGDEQQDRLKVRHNRTLTDPAIRHKASGEVSSTDTWFRRPLTV